MLCAARPFTFVCLLALSQGPQAFAQRETFDVATFTPPIGWQRGQRPGFLVFEGSRIRDGRMTSGQIFFFASHAASANAADNFTAEWHRLVVQPLRTNLPPRIETRQRPDGWTVVSGTIVIPQPGNPITSVLYTITGSGRVVSVLVNATSQEFLDAGASFVDALSLQPTSGEQTAATPTALVPPSPAPGPATPAPATGSFGDYLYAVPKGWNSTTYSDGMVHASPTFNNGERCQITVLQMRPASGDVAVDAIGAFTEIFKADPRQNAAYPHPSPTFTHGTSGDGWEYFMIQKSLGGQVGDYSAVQARVFAARLNDRLALVLTTSKVPLVSMCFGELVRDEWPRFFHSLHFKSWRPITQEQKNVARLAGTWTTATATVADRYSFAPNGRYGTAAAATYRTRISPNEVLATTQAFFGNGSYAIKGNAIVFTADDDKKNPVTRWFRLEDVSKDVGRTWTEQLCILDAAMGEVCYRREP
jgi:hypothetical protein